MASLFFLCRQPIDKKTKAKLDAVTSSFASAGYEVTFVGNDHVAEDLIWDASFDVSDKTPGEAAEVAAREIDRITDGGKRRVELHLKTGPEGGVQQLRFRLLEKEVIQDEEEERDIAARAEKVNQELLKATQERYEKISKEFADMKARLDDHIAKLEATEKKKVKKSGGQNRASGAPPKKRRKIG
jgi:exonuclease VII large subunit